MLYFYLMFLHSADFFFFFFNDTATTEIYTLSLHDALPILWRAAKSVRGQAAEHAVRAIRNHRERQHPVCFVGVGLHRDRKSTRLNSSHSQISYAVFCLKKKKHDNCTLYVTILMTNL